MCQPLCLSLDGPQIGDTTLLGWDNLSGWFCIRDAARRCMSRIREYESLDAWQIRPYLPLIIRPEIPLLDSEAALDQHCRWPVLVPQFRIELRAAAEQEKIIGAKQRVHLNQICEVKPAITNKIDVVSRSSRRRQLG